jgi:hypothetical protein
VNQDGSVRRESPEQREIDYLRYEINRFRHIVNRSKESAEEVEVN